MNIPNITLLAKKGLHSCICLVRRFNPRYYVPLQKYSQALELLSTSNTHRAALLKTNISVIRQLRECQRDLQKDEASICEVVNLLDDLYTLYADGAPCYLVPDKQSGKIDRGFYMGLAMDIDGEVEDEILRVLNTLGGGLPADETNDAAEEHEIEQAICGAVLE